MSNECNLTEIENEIFEYITETISDESLWTFQSCPRLMCIIGDEYTFVALDKNIIISIYEMPDITTGRSCVDITINILNDEVLMIPNELVLLINDEFDRRRNLLESIENTKKCRRIRDNLDKEPPHIPPQPTPVLSIVPIERTSLLTRIINFFSSKE